MTKKECFGNPLSKEECYNCDEAVDCLMSLYDKPIPSLILYKSDCRDLARAQEEAHRKIDEVLTKAKRK